MKLFREHIIVKVRESIFIDETQYKGVNGMQIVMSVLDQPERHIKNFGEVVCVPDELLHLPIAQDHVSAPGYHEDKPYTWKTTKDIEMDIRVGDMVYFHHNCLLPDVGMQKYNNYHLKSLKEVEDGKEVWYHYYRIKYQLCFAAVRYVPCSQGSPGFKWSQLPAVKKSLMTVYGPDGPHKEYRYFVGEDMYRKEIDMIGSYVFVEPDMETWDDISIPVPIRNKDGKVMTHPDGRVMMKPKDQWIVTKVMPETRYLRGWVKHVGKPLIGDSLELEPGMYVHFRRMADTYIRFEGENLYRMIQRNIGVIEPGRHKSFLTKPELIHETA